MDPIENSCIAGKDIKSIANQDEADCMAACTEWKGSDCLGVDWVVPTRLCYLNYANRDTVKLGTCANFRYRELDCSG